MRKFVIRIRDEQASLADSTITDSDKLDCSSRGSVRHVVRENLELVALKANRVPDTTSPFAESSNFVLFPHKQPLDETPRKWSRVYVHEKYRHLAALRLQPPHKRRVVVNTLVIQLFIVRLAQ